MNTPVHTCLQSLLDLPGAQNVLLIDHTGDCLAHHGSTLLSPAKLTVWSVLARASFSSGDEIGRRADCGSCQEVTNLHERGGSILRLVPGGQLLVLHFDSTPALGTLRLAMRETAEQLAACLLPAAPETPRLDTTLLHDSMPASLGAVLFEAYETTEDENNALAHAMMCCED